MRPPCTAKKVEINVRKMNSSAMLAGIKKIYRWRFVYYSTRIMKWIREEEIDFVNLEEGSFDQVMGEASGGGVIFETPDSLCVRRISVYDQ